MKKVVICALVFLFMLSGTAYAMTAEEFINTYPNEYIYKVCFPNGWVYYYSSPVEIEFSVDDWGGLVERGKCFVIENHTGATIIEMKQDGSTGSFDWSCYRIIPDFANWLGFEGDIDIFRWESGTGFFLPLTSQFLPGLATQGLVQRLGGPIQTILLCGFGIVSLMLSVKLLAGFLKRFGVRL